MKGEKRLKNLKRSNVSSTETDVESDIDSQTLYFNQFANIKKFRNNNIIIEVNENNDEEKKDNLNEIIKSNAQKFKDIKKICDNADYSDNKFLEYKRMKIL